jgi:HPt (histidine-containing phosphotransfer) domain-containing protein
MAGARTEARVPIGRQKVEALIPNGADEERRERITMENKPGKVAAQSQQDNSAAAHWNIQDLLERLDNDRAFLCELLTIFRQDSETSMSTAKQALTVKDLRGLERAAHTLKGMMRNLAMDHSADVAGNLETAAREGKIEAAVALFKQLEHAMQQLLPEVDAQLAEVKA